MRKRGRNIGILGWTRTPAPSNYIELQKAFGITRETLVQLARNSVDASFAGDQRKSQLLAEIDAWEAGPAQ